MLTSSRTRQAYLRVLVLVAVGVAAVAVLLNIPVVQAYFVTGFLGVLASCFFFCAPFTVRGRSVALLGSCFFRDSCLCAVILDSVGTHSVPVSAADVLQHERSP